MSWSPRSSIPVALAVCAVAAAVPGRSPADELPLAASPGWTGITSPEGVIAARQALMLEMERLMKPIDSFTAGDASDFAAQQSAAVTIATITLAVPHLFPPTTNLYEPAAETPVTLALPAIWEQFSVFSALAANTSAAAKRLSALNDSTELRDAGLALRAACDACHAPFLRAYHADSVHSEDVEFDFDSVFESNGDAGTAGPKAE